MIQPYLTIAPSPGMGRGVFTSEDIEKGTIIEVSPVIVLSKEERGLVDKTVLHDYIFEWEAAKAQACMAMGYVPVYNHAYRSNCEYEMDFEELTITVRTVRDIAKGEELFINYNGDWDDVRPVWFDVR
jgi:uncharacterized protein